MSFLRVSLIHECRQQRGARTTCAAFDCHAIVTNCSRSSRLVRNPPPVAAFQELNDLRHWSTGSFVAAQALFILRLNALHQVEFLRLRQTSRSCFFLQILSRWRYAVCFKRKACQRPSLFSSPSSMRRSPQVLRPVVGSFACVFWRCCLTSGRC